MWVSEAADKCRKSLIVARGIRRLVGSATPFPMVSAAITVSLEEDGRCSPCSGAALDNRDYQKGERRGGRLNKVGNE